MNTLEILIKAYVELVTIWGRMSAGENCSRVWDATKFLERIIKAELGKNSRKELDKGGKYDGG